MNLKWTPIASPGDAFKYLHLVETIERDIAQGELRRGDKLPSNRSLSEMFGITIATVTQAMNEAIRVIPANRLCNDLFAYGSYRSSEFHRGLGAAWVSRFGHGRPLKYIVDYRISSGIKRCISRFVGTE